MSKKLLSVKNLVVSYATGGGLFSASKKILNAVDDISFDVAEGEVVGLVGESGSGKTTSGRAVIGLAPISSGEIFFESKKINGLSRREFMPYRKQIQMVFQDPFASLDPRMKVGKIISEPIDIHFKMTSVEKSKRIANLLELVGLESDFANRYPHEFSGGQRQRIGIARALAVEPKFLICDEPVSALDVSVQASIINLLEDLKESLNLSMLFIAHDLAVVEHISDRILVMTKGKIVEEGLSEKVIANPKHPYTRSLIDAVPVF